MVRSLLLFVLVANLFIVSAQSRFRIGAICNDGWRSKSTGRGTCSHHGGVDYWLYSDPESKQAAPEIKVQIPTYNHRNPVVNTRPRAYNIRTDEQTLLQTLPNARFNADRREIRWRGNDDNTDNVTEIQHTTNVGQDGRTFKLMFVSTRSDGVTQFPFSRNYSSGVIVYEYFSGRLDPVSAKKLRNHYPYEPKYKRIKLHSFRSRKILLIPLQRYQQGAIEDYLAIYAFTAGKLRLLADDVPIGYTQEEEDATFRQYFYSATYQLYEERDEVLLLVKRKNLQGNIQSHYYRIAENAVVETRFNFNASSNNSKNMVGSTKAKADTVKQKSSEFYIWQRRVSEYHRLLRARNWNDVSKLYADHLDIYYGQGSKNVNEVLADHNDYDRKYRIERQEISMEQLVTQDLPDGGTAVTYPMTYDMTRRKDGKGFGYHLSCSLQFDNRGKITGVNSDIIRRFSGQSPAGTKELLKSYGRNLSDDDNLIVQSIVSDYHGNLEFSDFLSAMSRYAQMVDYYDRGLISHSEILADHQSYFRKYRVTHYEIDPSSWQIRQTDTGIVVTYGMQYGIIRKSDSKHFNYRLSNSMTIDQNGKVNQVNSKIEERL